MSVVQEKMLKGAIIDSALLYRYSLWRIWDVALPGILFVMLNPSTADADIDDPTIRRCIGFAKSWGYGSLEVVNLFAFRATNPNELRKCIDPIGPENDIYILKAVERSSKVIMAWGTNGTLLARDKSVLSMLKSYKPLCLEKSKHGHPKHPLYIAGNRNPQMYFEEATDQ